VANTVKKENLISPRQRLDGLRSLIKRAAIDAERNPADIELICVSKTQSEDRIKELLEMGERAFGENRVQEAQKKWSGLKRDYDVSLHLIGPLQSNKAEDAVALFDVIETVDRPKIAEAIAKAMVKLGRRPKLYIEVNTGNEPQKAGVPPSQVDEFIVFCHRHCGLEIEGLMCIPPQGEQSAPHFALLAQIARRNGIKKLSMGMSADFDIAIQMGATSVRIGTALFGPR
jgi:PLP dependent protein